MVELKEGMQTKPFVVHVDRTLIRSFAASVQNFDPIHHQVDAARKAFYKDIVAPPTLPIIFWAFADVYWLDQMTGSLIHGSQQFVYESPIMAGETYDCVITLKKVTEKCGKKGSMIIIEHTLSGYNESTKERIFTSDTTLILMPGMEVTVN